MNTRELLFAYLGVCIGCSTSALLRHHVDAWLMTYWLGATMFLLSLLVAKWAIARYP